MKQLEVKNLSFSYDESTHAVRHVSFAIEKGSYTTIIGHNGSGKSTIAKPVSYTHLAHRPGITVGNDC